MNGKQWFAVCAMCAGGVLLGAAGTSAQQVAYGAGEFTPTGGTLTGLGGLGGIGALITGIITFIKSAGGNILSDQNKAVLDTGATVLGNLLGGNTNAFGVTKHVALAVLFADRAYARDQDGMNAVAELSKRCISVQAAQVPQQAVQVY